MDTIQSVSQILRRSLCDQSTYQAYQQRLTEGRATRDENPSSHFCIYFLPYDAAAKKVFIVHHKKSGLWISPGGHIDKGETLFDTLNRETNEELGVTPFPSEVPSPFLLTITPIENTVLSCKAHYDVWYLVPTDGSNFDIDPKEFHQTKWMTIEEARKIVTDPANVKALGALEALRTTF